MMEKCAQCGSRIFRHKLNVDCEKDGRVFKTLYVHERCLDGFIAYVRSIVDVESIEKGD